MKIIKFIIPKGYIPQTIEHKSEGGDHYIEVELLAKENQCTNHHPHDVDTCEKCSKKL